MVDSSLGDDGDSGVRGPSFDFWGMMSRRKWWVIGFILFGTPLGLVYYILAPETYESFAQLIIFRRTPELPTRNALHDKVHHDEMISREDLSTELMVLGSPAIVAQAIQRGNLKKLDSFADDDYPLVSIVENLSVSKGGVGLTQDANVVNVSYRGRNRADCTEVVRAIIESYKASLSTRFENEGSAMLDLARKLRDDLNTSLRQKEEAHRQLVKNAPALSLGKGRQGYSAVETKVAEIEIERFKVQSQRINIGAKLTMLQGALKNPKNIAAVVLLATRMQDMDLDKGNDVEMLALADKFLQLTMSLNEMRLNYGESHPKVKNMKKTLADFQSMHPKIASRFGSMTKEILSEKDPKVESPGEIAKKAANALPKGTGKSAPTGKEKPSSLVGAPTTVDKLVAPKGKPVDDAAGKTSIAKLPAKDASPKDVVAKDAVAKDAASKDAVTKDGAAKNADPNAAPGPTPEELAAQLEKSLEAGPGSEEKEFLINFMRSLELELTKLNIEEAELSRQLQTAQVEARQLRDLEILEENALEDIKRSKTLYEQVAHKMSEAGLVKDFGGYITSVITEPTRAQKVAPSLPISILVAAIVSFVLGTGTAFVIDRRDNSFKSAEEIRGEIGVPVIGHVPIILPDDESEDASKPSSSKLDPILAVHHQPGSRYAESYRAVRTALYFSTHGSRHKVIQITGPSRDDGKSTLASNLAICVAQSGKKTLLIDGDFRRPRLDKLFGLSNEVGLSSVISGQGSVEALDALQSTEIGGLAIMTSGPRPNNPAELFTSAGFQNLLSMLREKFDFVIIDTPPLLAVTDASVVAHHVDGVILAMQITESCRPNALQAAEKLASIGARVIGVVVNGVGWKRSMAYRYVNSFGSHSRFYRAGNDMFVDAQRYIYGEAPESATGRAAPPLPRVKTEQTAPTEETRA